jgi:hypothetical protein
VVLFYLVTSFGVSTAECWSSDHRNGCVVGWLVGLFVRSFVHSFKNIVWDIFFIYFTSNSKDE